MSEKLTMEDLLGAVEWEGSIGELMSHGIDISDYDVTTEFAIAWHAAEMAYDKFSGLADWLNEQLYSGE